MQNSKNTVMDAEKRLDPVLLEAGLKELIEETKEKITSLNQEIAILKNDNEQLNSVIIKVESEKEDNLKRLEQVNSAIGEAKESNTALSQLLEAKQDELLKKKKDLVELLDKTEKQHSDVRTQIKKLAEEEKNMKNERESEKTINQQKQLSQKNRIAKLAESIKLKELEASRLQAELYGLKSKEKVRLESMQKEKMKLLEFFSHS